MGKLNPEDDHVLKELKQILGKKIGWNTFRVKIERNDVVGLGLSNQRLSTLPESIGNLSALKELRLYGNQLSTLPESIGNLKSLETLEIQSNQLTTLPESIGNLKSLEKLDLRDNQLTTLPESLGNLTSLKELYLHNNKLSALPESLGNLSSLQTLWVEKNQLRTLPKSFWRLKNLTSIDLDKNQWKYEWRRIAKYDAPKVLEICRQEAPISVFLSCSKGDEKKYHIIKIMDNLMKCEEIREISNTGVQKILENQLFLFIATHNSIVDPQCQNELGLALTHDIGIIPIKGTDITFEELTRIDLRAEGHGFFNLKDKKGFEFDGDEANLEAFCDDLYEYIKQYKRDFNLFDAEARKIDEERQNVKTIIDELIESAEFREILEENLAQLEELSEELRTEQIIPFKYLSRCAQILNSESE